MRLQLCLLCFALNLFGRQLDVEVKAKSAVLINADTGAVLFEKEAHTKGYPASTTKVATSLFLLEKQADLNQMVTVSPDCLKMRPLRDQTHPYWLEGDGIMLGLRRGEQVSFDVLLHGMMLGSANDAANTAAEGLAGTIPQFMEMLNSYLQGLGCKNTRFANPHGLYHVEHYSTPYDMALMMRRGLQIPKFRQVMSTLSYSKPKTNKQPAAEIKLTNPLMKPKSRHFYSKAVGGKTGYTMAARYPFVSAAEQDGRTLIAVVFGGEKSEYRFEDAKRLFEAAFAEEKEKRRLIGSETVFTREISSATSLLKASVAKSVVIEYFPAEEPNCKAALHWNPDSLPIRKGQKVGEVHIQDAYGNLLQKGDLVALENVEENFFLGLKRRFFELFR